MKKIAILGLPNTGKTHVFNMLTGGYSIVANYPHTTVEISRAQCTIGSREYEAIDTPGIHSLYIHSEEEIVVRDLLFEKQPDVVVQCIDANRMKQSLALSADLLGLRIPLVLCVNALDEARSNGTRVDIENLSRCLGIGVVGIAGIHENAVRALDEAIRTAHTSNKGMTYSKEIERAIECVASTMPQEFPHRRAAAVLLLSHDHSIIRSMKALWPDEQADAVAREAEQQLHSFRGNCQRAIALRHSQWIAQISDAALTHIHQQDPNRFAQQFGRLSRHPVWGFPILGLAVVFMYVLVVHVAGLIEGALSALVVDPIVGFIGQRLGDGLWHEFLIGHYGILTLGLFNAFCTVLPILSVFFLAFGLLEDMGYIPNLCVLAKRIFEKAGLTGKAIMPLVLGFGCKTMATLTTRGLTSRKEKLIAVYLIAFAIPCSAQLGIDMAVLGRVGFAAFLIAYGTLVTVEIVTGVILNRIIPDTESSDFIQELPPIRMPDLKALWMKTYHRLYWFLKEAVPIFLIAALVLFLMDAGGVLDATKRLLRPVVINWLGLPLNIVDVLILSLARHEAAAGLLLAMVDNGELTYIQCIVAVVITTMFVPCFANIVAMCKEVGVRTGLVITLAINISSFILAGLLSKILILTIGG